MVATDEISSVKRIFIDFMLAGKSAEMKKQMAMGMLILAQNKTDEEILNDVSVLHRTLDPESYMLNFIKPNLLLSKHFCYRTKL